jgi:phosphate/sulfate permease
VPNCRCYNLVHGDGPSYSGLNDAHHNRRDHWRGATRRTSAVRWTVAPEIVTAWILTMPAAAVIGAIYFKLASPVL